MTSDLYTKFVLTVIALSLFVIAIQLTTKEAHAQSGVRFSPSGAMMVTICDPLGSPSGMRGGWTCADVHTQGLTVTAQR